MDNNKEHTEAHSPAGHINIIGAREHNLKNINVSLPRHSLSVITGLSGSGKSSLAFDTIYAEGQRRYIETFSAYARNFLDSVNRPDVDEISGLSPVISIEQKTTNRNPRSTVGTITEIYDFLRLLFARAATAYSYVTGEPMVKYTEEKIVDMLLSDYEGRKVLLLAPLVRTRKGHYKELFETVRKKGFLTVRVDGELREAVQGMKLDRYKNHDIEVVVDKLKVSAKDVERLRKSVGHTLAQGNGLMMVYDKDAEAEGKNAVRYFSKNLMCPVSGISYREPAPHNFSFNSAQGACPHCKGLGTVSVIDQEKVIPNPKLSIREGGLAPLGKYRNAAIFWEIEAVLAKYDCDLNTPLQDVSEEALAEIFNGSAEQLRIPADTARTTNDLYLTYDGLGKYLQQMADSEMTAAAQRWAEQFSRDAVCPDCHGTRLNRKTIYDPCPAGWRIPDGGPEGVWNQAGEKSYSMDFYSKGVKFNLVSGGTAWYPATGYIHRGEGDIRLAGQFADYWTSKTATQTVTTFEFHIKTNADDSKVGLYYNNKTRGEGHAVRCQKL